MRASSPHQYRTLSFQPDSAQRELHLFICLEGTFDEIECGVAVTVYKVFERTGSDISKCTLGVSLLHKNLSNL